MNRHLRCWAILLPTLLVLSSSKPAWAHFRGGFGIYLGPGSWYPGPYYDPYYDYPYPYPYYPYYPYEPYAYVPYARVEPQSQREKASKPDESRHDLTYIEGQLTQAREVVEYDYEDGDISKEQLKQSLHHLKDIQAQARAEAKANGGYITGEQEKELLDEIHGGSSRAGQPYAAPASEESGIPLAAMDQQIDRLRKQVDEKLKEGNITKAQHNGLIAYLDRTEKQTQAQASTNGGALTHDQDEALRQQLERVERSLQSNLITN